MGGRGAPSPFSRRRTVWVDTSKRGYTAVTSDQRSAGEKYAFFDQIAAAGEETKGHFDKKMEQPSWTVISTDPNSENKVDLHRQHTFGLEKPTLMWFKDGSKKELYMEGVTTEQFLERSGLAFSYNRGEEAKLFKRMSRIMRSHTIEQRFDNSKVKIFRNEDPTGRYDKVHDGAGVISREMLRKFLVNDQLPFGKQQKMLEEIEHAGRVEFTIMTKLGQEKGHAMVRDTPLLNAAGEQVDFVLPSDIKREVKLTDSDTTWVGINFVHGSERLNMDVQSLANFSPTSGSDQAFLSAEKLAGFVRDDVARFETAIQAGIDPTIKVDEFMTPEEVMKSPHKEFGVSGGDIRQYPTHVARVFDQKIESMEFERDYNNRGRKLSIPIPGMRLYVMPDEVGQAAGIDISVPKGMIEMDKKRATAWINAEDWLRLTDTSESESMGIRDVLGGADNDDGLNLVPFVDQSEGAQGKLRVATWRSPNEDGEYVLLRPTANSDLPKWEKADGEVIQNIEANSDHLPTRVDHANRMYQGLVTVPSGGEQVNGFDFADMEAAAKRGAENAGVLGGYISPNILHRAAYGESPDDPPASTEEIIDATNKNGGDLTPVKKYSYDLSARMATSIVPIPRYMSDRLIFDPDLSKDARATLRGQVSYTDGSHYIDKVTQAMRDEIDNLRSMRETMGDQAHAPNKLYDTVFNEADAGRYFALGSDLNKTFGRTLSTIRVEKIKAYKVDKALNALGDEHDFSSDALKIRAFADGQITRDQLESSGLEHKGALRELTAKVTPKEKYSKEYKEATDFNDRDFDRAKWAVWEKLTFYPPEEQGKILRAGLADDMMGGKGGKSMWRYAVRDEMGGEVYHNMSADVAHELQKTGLGNAMNQSLREVDLLNYHSDQDGKVQQSYAAEMPIEPNSYRPIQFSSVAQIPPTQALILHIEAVEPVEGGNGQTRLVAKTDDGRLFGQIQSGDLKAGDHIQLKYNKPASMKDIQLFGVFEQL